MKIRTLRFSRRVLASSMHVAMTTFLALVLLIPAGLRAQNHDQVWIFGSGGGYDWMPGGGLITNSAINTQEGCASISDDIGNLLFYTDGIDVWDDAHNQVNTFSMTGHPSSTQSGVIIPKPGSSDYYILTVGRWGGQMAYYEANMSGGSISSVTNPGSNVLIASSSEKIAALKKPCDPDTIWVVGHNFAQGRYEVFAATNSGITFTGETINDLFTSTAQIRALGVLRFNHQGTVLASAVQEEHIELMEFDPLTGTFVGAQLKYDVSTTDFPSLDVYGLEFSPNDRMLYNTITGDLGNTNIHSLWQYDVSSLNELTIESTRQLIYSDVGATRLEPNQLQLAPDGNIYVAMRGYGGTASTLGRISDPNVGTSANFNSTAIAANLTERGLPTFLVEVAADTMDTVDVCEGETVQLIAPVGTNYEWTPATGLSCVNCQNPVASPTSDITYTVQFLAPDLTCTRLRYPIDVEICDPCDTVAMTARFTATTNHLSVNVLDQSLIQAPHQFTYIEWNFGDGTGWWPDQPGTDFDHVYAQEGEYVICLHVAVFITPDICCHDTICDTITVAGDPCEGFTADFLHGQVGGTMDVTFQDISTPANYPGNTATEVTIWDFGDGTTFTTSGTNHGPFFHPYQSPGWYTVTMVAIDHLNDTLCCLDTITRDIRVFRPGLRINPSVVNDRTEITLSADQPQEFRMRISKADGRLVEESSVPQSGRIYLDTSNLLPGIYFVEMAGRDERYLQRFVKQ